MATTTDTWVELPDAPPIDGLRFRRPRGDDAEYDAFEVDQRSQIFSWPSSD